MLDFHVE